jgi:hypothetical protein
MKRRYIDAYYNLRSNTRKDLRSKHNDNESISCL